MADKYERHSNRAKRSTLALATAHADVVEEAYKIACDFPVTRSPYHEWDLGSLGELSVESGSQNDPITCNGGYWVSIRLRHQGFVDGCHRLGGIWGTPAARYVTGVVTVPEVIAEMLQARGWTLYTGEKCYWIPNDILLSPPGVTPVSYEFEHWQHKTKLGAALLERRG